jgi:thioredoxin reductase
VRRSVVIVGGGPAGLSAARVLVAAGLRDVLVLERNPAAGGVPRFCGHRGWGMLDFGRFWTGPGYAARLVQSASGAEIRTNASVLALHPGGELDVSTPAGIERVAARVVLLATGTRESPRAARLLPGTRPWGVLNTGAFQEMAHAGGMVPFRRPAIIGGELVGFSALLTARHAGIRPVALVEEGARVAAPWPAALVARLAFGVSVLAGARILGIEGGARVEALRVEHGGRERVIPCDGVVVSGRFLPDAAFVRASHLGMDGSTGGPAVDADGRCTDPAFFAAGNVLRPARHSGAVAREGMAAARAILRALDRDAVASAHGAAR